jgi:hypothetical protein
MFKWNGLFWMNEMLNGINRLDDLSINEFETYNVKLKSMDDLMDHLRH